MWQWHGMNGWAWFWMTTMMVVFWGIVAWLVVMLVRQRGPSRRDAEDVLAERFARGEIDEDEYRRRRELIRH